MTIITWNCNMAFRKKAAVIMRNSPDILVIQECEHPDKLKDTFGKKKPVSALWFGNNMHKGLGIFSFNGFNLKKHASHNSSIKLVIPVIVKKDAEKFMLFAIWAHNPTDPDGQYITQVWKAVHHYKKLIRKKGTILTGDFNSNSIWDKPRREGNHTTVVQLLKTKGIESTYHVHFSQQQGSEKHPTYYLYRHKDKSYHLDYCFASADFINRLKKVKIGSFAKWKKHSDHTPVITEFNPAGQPK